MKSFRAKKIVVGDKKKKYKCKENQQEHFIIKDNYDTWVKASVKTFCMKLQFFQLHEIKKNKWK